VEAYKVQNGPNAVYNCQ